MKTALVIGAGPAGLMAAEILSGAGVRVTVADQMPSVGRKFLMAGKSGLNLTKFDPDVAAMFDPPMRQIVADFGPDQVIAWAEGLGQPVFTGSTGRVFPRAMKASPLLRAWLRRLEAQGVTFQTRHRWTGWDGGAVAFETRDGPLRVHPDVTVLTLGGGSWARLGSDGTWQALLDDIAPIKPANCGFAVDWSPHMAPFFGQPVKATRLQAGPLVSRGEWVITRHGIEGGGVYEVSAAVRDGAQLFVDLMPDVTTEALRARIASTRKKISRAGLLKSALRLPPVKAALFNEFTHGQSPAGDIVQSLKALAFRPLQPLPMDQAISTAGGLRFAALTADLMLRARPGTFAAGEMLDWEAPTGGYLITGCLATGRRAAQGALAYLAAGNPPQA